MSKIIPKTIPKTIHYCWFGNNPLSEMAVKCIESWKKYLPDYEIKEWNESNFDVDCCDYVREAYKAQKWAFVSDYARFWILYQYGGIYFDTDVELIKPIDDLIEKGSFMGCEPTNSPKDTYMGDIKSEKVVNAGLGLAAAPGLALYREILDDYEQDHFIMPEKGGPKTVVTRTTEHLVNHGLSNAKTIQCIDGIYIYPPEYFCPLNFYTGCLEITSNTRSIHLYTASWHNDVEKVIDSIKRYYAVRGKGGCWIESVLTLPLRMWNKLNRLGIVGTIRFILKKLRRE